ncbi:MAG: diguanylate cyclase [Deltaproteobacteria bacterium]|nr:diguanylate cyclase [Deltaproteobacteria bacterium]
MTGRKTKILIADGNARNYPIFERGLKNFDLTFAQNGADSVKLLKEKDFNLLIINNSLSEMPAGGSVTDGGLELLRETQRLSGNTLPVILVINEGEEKAAIAARKAGASDTLSHLELESRILPMTVMRALEHKKWEKLYLNLSENQVSSYLKDPLTQIYNKYYFNTRLKEEMSRSERYDFPLTMALFHIDQYPEMRKKYGKQTTDQLMKELGQYLVLGFRSSDLLARLDEDQFVLLQPHTTLDEARLAWERLFNNLADHSFTVDGKNFRITLHVAMTALNKQIEEIDALIQKMEKYIDQNGDDARHLLLYAPEA